MTITFSRIGYLYVGLTILTNYHTEMLEDHKATEAAVIKAYIPVKRTWVTAWRHVAEGRAASLISATVMCLAGRRRGPNAFTEQRVAWWYPYATTKSSRIDADIRKQLRKIMLNTLKTRVTVVCQKWHHEPFCIENVIYRVAKKVKTLRP